jgi:hypothetical protein
LNSSDLNPTKRESQHSLQRLNSNSQSICRIKSPSKQKFSESQSNQVIVC